MVLSHSPGRQPFGAGLQNAKKAAPPADADDKENKSSNSLRKEASKPWKANAHVTKTSLNLSVRPTEMVANEKGVKMMFSPGPVKVKAASPERSRPRNGTVLQFSPGNGRKKATMPVLSSSLQSPAARSKKSLCLTPNSANRISNGEGYSEDEDVGLFDPREASMSLDDGMDSSMNVSNASRKSLAGTPPWAVKDQITPETKKAGFRTDESRELSAIKPAVLNPDNHKAWIEASDVWKQGNDESLSTNESSFDISRSSFLGSSMNEADVTDLEELERNLTPSKLARYVDLNMQKEMEYEKQKTDLIEEMTEVKAQCITLEREKKQAEQEADQQVELFEHQISSMNEAFEAEKKDLRKEISKNKKMMTKMEKQIVDLQQEIWEKHGDDDSKDALQGELDQLKFQETLDAEVEKVKAELNGQYQTQTEELNKLHAAQIDSLKAEKQKLNDFLNEKTSNQREMEDLQCVNSELVSTNSELLNNVSDLESQVSSLADDKLSLEAELKKLVDELKEVREYNTLQNHTANAKAESFQAEVDAARARVVELEASIEMYQEESNNAEEAQELLRAENEELKKQADMEIERQATLEVEMEENVSELQLQIKALESELEEIKTEKIEEMTGEVENLTNALSESRENCELLESKIEEMTDQVENLTNALSESRENCELLESKIEEMTGEVDNLTNALSESKENCESLESKIEEMSGERQEIQSFLDQKIAAIKELESDKLEAGRNISKLNSDISNIELLRTKELELAQDQLVALQSQIDVLKRQSEQSNEGAKKEVQELTIELEELRAANKHYSDSTVSLETKVTSLEDLVAYMEAKGEEINEELSGEIASLQTQLDEMTAESEKTAAASIEKIANLELDLEQALASKQETNEELSGEIASLQTQLDEMTAEKEETTILAGDKIAALEAKLEDAEEAHQEASEKAALEIESLESSIRELNESVASLSQEVEQRKQQIEAISSELQASKENEAKINNDFEEEKTTLEQTIAELKETIKEQDACSEERTRKLNEFAVLVDEMDKDGARRMAEFDESSKQLELALENKTSELNSTFQELESVKAALVISEDGRAKAEQAAADADVEAESEARRAQEASMQKDIAVQQYQAACGVIEELKFAYKVAEERRSEAENRSEQWKEEVTALQILRKKLHNELIDLKGNIRVFCRIRPSKNQLNGKEASKYDQGSLVVDQNPVNSSGEVIEVFDNAPVGTDSGLSRYNDGKRHSFGFDKVYDGKSTQEDVYKEVQPLVQSSLDGFPLCIFAYGQTGSGKTHTMIGDTEMCEEGAADTGLQRGIVYRACEQVFEDMNNCCTGSGQFEWSVTIEAVEIYNEKLRDLLPAKTGAKNKQASFDTSSLDIRTSKEGNIFIEGIEKHDVKNCNEAVGFLNSALSQRATKATKCNDQSSRSHAVLIFRFSKTDLVSGETKAGALHFCDLAGSERLAKSGSGDNAALLKEAQAINKSLSALGNTMSALVSGGRHVPFRDSKLTFLLQECFTGSGKSLLVCALSPESDSVSESVGSLRFAQTVSQVTANNRQRCPKCGENCSKKTADKTKKVIAEKPGEKRQRSSSKH